MKVIVILFLFSLAVFSKTADWSDHSSLVWILRDEILKVDQLEKVGHEVKCHVTWRRESNFPGVFLLPSLRYITEMVCEGNEYQPPTSAEAEAIAQRIPNYQDLFARKTRQNDFSSDIPSKIKQLITALWNKTEPITWDGIMDQMVK